MVGSAVKKLKVGDVVGACPIRASCGDCEYCNTRRSNMCRNRIFMYDEGYFGGYATHVQLEESWCFPIPKNLDISTSPPIMCAGVTVYAPLKRHGKPGMTCAVIGIGGLGHLAIQFANKMGMTVSAFTTKTNTPEPYKALGAAKVEHSTDLEQLKKNKGKYDIVLNTLFLNDEEVYLSHQRLTAPCGTYINVGLPDLTTKFKLDTGHAIRNMLTIAGSCVGSIEETQECVEFAANYVIKCIVENFDFGEFDKAFEKAEKLNPKFRNVIKVSDWAKKNGLDK